MLFRRLDATFGKLERRTLAFSPGLNVIEAPNEAGKSTLTALLRVMLYGLSTRERGALADKNRFTPWSGAPMQGSLELNTEAFGNVTIRRDTARANAPMGRFSATYTGTGEEVAALTAADCGETLLGVSREVYERSAFIRQSGLAVDSDAELERRIAALVGTGEEGSSYTEAAAALKKQLNVRRANARSGTIPTLEREIEADEAALRELRALRVDQAAAEAELAELREAERRIRAELAIHEQADRQKQYLDREQAKHDAEAAEREARVFRKTLADTGVPPREVLEESKIRLHTAAERGRELKAAKDAQQEAEAALHAFDDAKKPYALPEALFLGGFLVCLTAFLGILALRSRAAYWLLPIAAVSAVLFFFFDRNRRKAARQRGELETALREAETLRRERKREYDKVLSLVYAVVPAGDISGANTYVYENLARYDMLAQRESEAQSKRSSYENTPRPEIADLPAAPIARPAQSPESLRGELERTLARRAEAQSRADRAAGQLQGLGDPGEREAALADKRERLTLAREEYDAVALAMTALDEANTELQKRFSPELGRRAAEYFGALTGGKYDAVLLDRTFRALATETGDRAARDVTLLSRGAADQLYLAVRLAICDMVLPEDRHIPLVLDDAFTSFDDTRCESALELLLRIAQTRQVLLLSCQHREAAFLKGRANVTLLSL